MLTYRRALINEVKDQIEPLAKKHLIETDKRLPNFEDVRINFDMYNAMEEQGLFAVFVAEKEDKVVAYMAMYVVETPHIEGYLQAVSDALFVDREARKEGAASVLINMAEDHSKSIGCSYMTLCFKADNPHKKFCNSIGYEEDDVMYSKSLEV